MVSREQEVREAVLAEMPKFLEIQDVQRDWWHARADYFNHLVNLNLLKDQDLYIYKMVVRYLDNVNI